CISNTALMGKHSSHADLPQLSGCMRMSETQLADWDVPAPHIVDFTVVSEHIDHMGHVNNAVYLGFMESAAWSHTRVLGLSWQDYQRLDVGCVVHRHELDYL